MDAFIVGSDGAVMMADRPFPPNRKKTESRCARVELSSLSVTKLVFGGLASGAALMAFLMVWVVIPSAERTARSEANDAIDLRMGSIVREAQRGMATEREFNNLRAEMDRRHREILEAIESLRKE